MNNPADSHITSNSLLIPAIKSWQMYLSDQGRSHFTIKAFIGDLKLMTSFFPTDTAVGSVTTADLNRFLDWMQKERPVPCSPKSLSRRITSIKAFFRWLTQSGRIEIDPAEKVLQQSVISPLPEVLTHEECTKVIEVAARQRTAQKADARPYTLLLLLLSTGIKKGECLALNINHLEISDPLNQYLFVRYANNASRYKERKISLPNTWVQVYQEYLLQYKPDEPTITGSKKRVIKPTTQENKFNVIKFIGNNSSLIIGLTILFRRSQIMAAVISVLAS